MDLYSLVGADQHVDSGGARYLPDLDTGAFHFPDEVSDLIGGFAVKGKKLWETETERADRLHGMDLARRRDPATMLSMQEENVKLMRQLTQLTAQLASFQISQAPSAPADAPAESPAGPDAGEDPARPDQKAAAPAAKAARAAKATPKTP